MSEPEIHRDRRWIRYLLAGVVAWAAFAFIPGLVSHFSGSPHRPPFDARTVGAACPDDRDWTCGSLRVPFNRNVASDGSTSVHFRVLPRELTHLASAGTIVVIAGGPGQASMRQFRWAEFAFRGFHADHDLLLVDNRGTGTSGAIDCPMLQAQQPYLSTQAVAQCRGLLGSRADDYGTVAAVDDLEQILTVIHARHVELYAESYGTYFAQVFALRHPKDLQRIVLDGAYPLAVDPWHRDDLPAALVDVRAVCEADPRCGPLGDPLSRLAEVLPALRSENLRGTTSDAYGRLVTVDGSVENLAFALEEAGRDGSAYRELPAALTAATRTSNPDPLPLLRLIAERERPVLAATREAAPPASSFSVGLNVADTCADDPHPFRLTDPLSKQLDELDSARSKLLSGTADLFAPFLADEVVPANTTCTGWPAPTDPPPTSHVSFPNTPTLVMEGSLDTITPPDGARAVADALPDAHYLKIPNVGHVTALSDSTLCAGDIAATFLATGQTDTSCTPRIPAPSVIDAFPTRLGEEPPAVPVLTQDAAGLSADDLRRVGVVRDAISDVLWRWGRVGILSGHGLRGGTFLASGSVDQAQIDLRLHAIKWTTDTELSGALRVTPGSNAVAGAITLTTPGATLVVNVESNLYGSATDMTITGNLSGHHVNLVINAPLNL